MLRIATAVLVTVLLAGCQQAVSGTPTPEPVKLDCDLIFPGPGAA